MNNTEIEQLRRENSNLREAVANLPSPHPGWRYNPEWAALGPESNWIMPGLSQYEEHFGKLVDELREKHEAQLSEWTRAQLIQVISQLVASGDFKLLVAPDNRYGTVYVPWAEVERLKSKVRELEQELSDAHARLVDLDEDVD